MSPHQPPSRELIPCKDVSPLRSAFTVSGLTATKLIDNDARLPCTEGLGEHPSQPLGSLGTNFPCTPAPLQAGTARALPPLPPLRKIFTNAALAQQEVAFQQAAGPRAPGWRDRSANRPDTITPATQHIGAPRLSLPRGFLLPGSPRVTLETSVTGAFAPEPDVTHRVSRRLGTTVVR